MSDHPMEDPPIPRAFETEDTSHWLQEADPPKDRMDLLVGPQDKKWKLRHRYFSHLLGKDIPIKSIIRENFTHHQYRLLAPAERADVKEIQADNTKRYKALLASRFKGVEDSLATKLTMMYFGLPAAPIDNPLEDIARMLGHDEEEVPRYNVKPPLHFLTAHDHRNWGKDSLKAKEAMSYSLPLPKAMEPTLGLRGGETDDDGNTKNGDYIDAGQAHATFKDQWNYLYGLNGRLPFVPTKWSSLSKVLRQLLHPVNDAQKEFTLIVYNPEGGKPEIVHDTLPLQRLFVDTGHTETNKGPMKWEPLPIDFETDTIRIGRSLGHAPNGPEEEVVSYAYLALPRAEPDEDDWVIGHGSNQYNAHFCATMNVLFGVPKDTLYHHALFRLFDKNRPDVSYTGTRGIRQWVNKPDGSRTIPIVYGAMGFPMWVWNSLHPLNNPDACWMVECHWLSPDAEAIIMPNYYPLPEPHLVSRHGQDDVSRLRHAYQQICQMTTEAFDSVDCQRLDSVIVIEGDNHNVSDTNEIDGIEVEHRESDRTGVMSLAGKLAKSPSAYRTVHPNWLPGHCRLFPNWHAGENIFVEMPRLTSSLSQFYDAMKELYSLAAPPTHYSKDPREDTFFLEHSGPCEILEAQDIDSPSYVIGPDTTEDEWFLIRQSITSPEILVFKVRVEYTDWASSIWKHNLWGVRMKHEDMTQYAGRESGLKRDSLQVQDLNTQMIDLLHGYPQDPVPIKYPFTDDDLSRPWSDGSSQPPSRKRKMTFKSPPLLQVKTKEDDPEADGLRFPTTEQIERAHTPDGQGETDIGLLATAQPPRSWVPSPSPRGQSPSPVAEPESSSAESSIHEIDENVSESEHESEHEHMDVDEQPDGSLFGDDSDENSNSDDSEFSSVDRGPGSNYAHAQAIYKYMDKYGIPRSNRTPPKTAPQDNPSASKSPDPPTVPNPPTNPPMPEKKPAGPDHREHTWATQPSIFTNEASRAWPSDTEISVPLTAPPVEKMHRLSSNVPMYSKAVLTPTEQAELQHSFWDVRSMLLGRISTCPYKNCNFTYRLNEREKLDEHILAAHERFKCPFCQDRLYESYDEDQRMKHLREKHPQQMRKIAEAMQAGNARVRAELSAQNARQPPQTGPRPAAPRPAAGSIVPPVAAASRPAAEPTATAVATGSTVPFGAPSPRHAFGSALPPPPSASTAASPARNPFSQGQVPNPFVGSFSGPSTSRLSFATAAAKPASFAVPAKPGAASPTSNKSPSDTWGPQMKAKEPPRQLKAPLLNWYDKRGESAYTDPPQECPVPGCPLPKIGHFSSHGILQHFMRFHHIGNMMYDCPFCKLPFYTTEMAGNLLDAKWRDQRECLKHLDCHIYQLWDKMEQVGNKEQPTNSPGHRSGVSSTMSQGELVMKERLREMQRQHDEAVASRRAAEVAAGTSRTLPPAAPRLPADTHLNTTQVSPPTVSAGVQAALTGSVGTQSLATQAAPPQAGPTQVAIGPTTISDSKEAMAAASKLLKKCHYFEKCGCLVGAMSDKQYRHHLRQCHPKEHVIFDEDEEDGDDKGSDGDADDGADDDDEGDDGDDSSRRSIRVETADPESGASDGSIMVANKKPKRAQANKKTKRPKKTEKPERTKKSTRLTPAATDGESDAAKQSDVASSVSRGRKSKRPPPSKLKEATDDAAMDAEVAGSGSKSSNTVGRGRTPKKAKKRRPTGENDGEYEDDEYETDDHEEMQEESAGYRQRANSPDWVKELGPGDPNFDPDDNMYCSKCLRKAPKRRSKSPNRSPIGRAREVEAHWDENKCCRIRNGIGSTEHLPNRSGWIPQSKLPGKLGVIKEKFLRRYPTYKRTIYPLQDNHHNATVWASDPNNDENKDWHGIPWPPYEGFPPFPGDWDSPGGPWDDTPSGRRRRNFYLGYKPSDGLYKYQSDSDSGDDIQPDVNDIPNFQDEYNLIAQTRKDLKNLSKPVYPKRPVTKADATKPDGNDTPAVQSDASSSGLKRPAVDADGTDGPAPKKVKESIETATTKTPKAKRTKKTRGAPPSRTSSRIRQQRATSSAPSATPSKATSKAPSVAEESSDPDR
ncbi:hypothetical protein FIE12Z_9499 [Fusarium flagelliforme]|uniref:C2H2-type domain-containing protein n=1 Tax=Fusarium flagelliforme TaxID=2675880 RepID=A0A395MEG7_9HYPO|nr:hypothetical protein FIE12Z_9499 [Fusarium flagelliforme]